MSHNFYSRMIANANAPPTVLKALGPAKSGNFRITGLSGLIVGNPVRIWQTAGAIPSRGNARDEIEYDVITLAGYIVNATTIQVFWTATGWVVGDYEFAYRVQM